MARECECRAVWERRKIQDHKAPRFEEIGGDLELVGGQHETYRLVAHVEKCPLCRDREAVGREAGRILSKYVDGVIRSDPEQKDIYQETLVLLRKYRELGMLEEPHA